MSVFAEYRQFTTAGTGGFDASRFRANVIAWIQVI